jgi:hypothetical protein
MATTTDLWTYEMSLAEIVMGNRPETAPCMVLTETHRLAGNLHEHHGVPLDTLRDWSRAYARRVDALGPEEFDARCDRGM